MIIEEVLKEDYINILSYISINQNNEDTKFSNVFLDKLEYIGDSNEKRYIYDIGFDASYIKFNINDITKSNFLYSKDNVILIEYIDDNLFKFYNKIFEKVSINLKYDVLKTFTSIDKEYFKNTFNIDYDLLIRVDIYEDDMNVINKKILTKELFKDLNFILEFNWFLYLDEFIYIFNKFEYDEYLSAFDLNDFKYEIYIDTTNIEKLNKNKDTKELLLNDEYIKEIIKFLDSITNKNLYKINFNLDFEENDLFISFLYKYTIDEAEKFLNITLDLFKLEILKYV